MRLIGDVLLLGVCCAPVQTGEPRCNAALLLHEGLGARTPHRQCGNSLGKSLCSGGFR